MHETQSLGERAGDIVAGAMWPSDMELRRAAQGSASLYEAFHTFARYQDAHAHAAADLFEREIWAMTVIVNASDTLWVQPASPTLRFAIPGPTGPAPYHLELGRFAHLAALTAPKPEEQVLISAATPGWARVHLDQERLRAGHTGALACAYVPISTGEAVATLGFGRILSQIESRAWATGKTLLAQAEEQCARERRVLQVERALGWVPEPVATAPHAQPMRTRLMLALLQEGRALRLTLSMGLLGVVLVLLSIAIGIPHALLLLLLAGPALLIWNYVYPA